VRRPILATPNRMFQPHRCANVATGLAGGVCHKPEPADPTQEEPLTIAKLPAECVSAAAFSGPSSRHVAGFLGVAGVASGQAAARWRVLDLMAGLGIQRPAAYGQESQPKPVWANGRRPPTAWPCFQAKLPTAAADCPLRCGSAHSRPRKLLA